MISSPTPGRVSILVLNWNSGELGRAATASALAQSWPDVEVLVIDNASDDDSLATILAACPGVVVVQNEENLGFGGGMNSGIEVATGEFILPLNCDAELDADYVADLIPTLRAHPDAAAVGGSVASSRVETSGPLQITRTMRTASLPREEPIVCDKVNGACPLFRTEALQAVQDVLGGPYDASYFTYGEDVDLALTLRRLGWHYRFVPGARARHVRSFGSAPRLADRRGLLRRTTLRNRHRNIIRHTDGPWPAVSVFALAQDIGFVVLCLGRGDVQALRDVVGAWVEVARGLRRELDRRRTLRQSVPVGAGV
jgi:GT2 family glycosyltransferase